MRQNLLKLWNDDGGAIIAIEWIFFVVIVLIGLVVGFVAVRNAVVDELTVVAQAVDSLGVCYSFSGLSNCESSVCGTNVIDNTAGASLITAHKAPADHVTTLLQNPCQ